MSKIPKNVHVNDHVLKKIVIIDNTEKKYTIPKLHIPLGEDGKPTVAKKKYWYIYYYYKLPTTNAFDWNKPIKIKGGINRKKTVTERKSFGKKMVAQMTKLLEEGFCPYENADFIEQPKENLLTVIDALNYAVENKRSEVKQNTIDDYIHRKDNFILWLKAQGVAFNNINDLNKKHLSSFLNYINKKSSNRNANNYKSSLSSLFTKLKKDGHLEKNLWLDIDKRKTSPKKHKVFTKDEIKAIKTYLDEHDPYLYKFMVFVAYTFLRPLEATRIQLKHIDLKNRLIRIGTKTEESSTVLIIDKLMPVLESFNLERYDQNDYLFTPKNCPGPYKVAKEKQRRDYFTKRFNKIKKPLGLDIQNSIYGIRHTIATDIYNGFITEGFNERETILKMLPITRHKNEKSLRNYLRSVDAFITKDYSERIKTEL